MYRKQGAPMYHRTISDIANVKHIDPIGNGSPGYVYGDYHGQPTANMQEISEISRLQTERKCSWGEASRIWDEAHPDKSASKVDKKFSKCKCGALYYARHGAIACPACRSELKAIKQKEYYQQKRHREHEPQRPKLPEVDYIDFYQFYILGLSARAIAEAIHETHDRVMQFMRKYDLPTNFGPHYSKRVVEYITLEELEKRVKDKAAVCKTATQAQG